MPARAGTTHPEELRRLSTEFRGAGAEHIRVMARALGKGGEGR